MKLHVPRDEKSESSIDDKSNWLYNDEITSPFWALKEPLKKKIALK